MGLLLLFFILSITFSFLCSIMEAVLLSVTPAYTKRQVQEGTQTGKLLEYYKEDIDRPLSAILTLNTIAHTVGAIGVGAQAGKLYGAHYFSLLGFQISYESVIATVMTLAILVLSEIIPKTIGANNWRALTPFTVGALRIMLWVLAPFVWMSQFITRRLKKDKSRSVLSRADFAAMAQAYEESGTLDEKESTIIRNLLHLERLTVREIMTPRTVMIISDEKTTAQQFYDDHDELRYSRIPIYEEYPDNITGLVLKDDILEALAEDKHETPLSELKRKVLAISDEANVFNLFETLTHQRSHLAVVMDTYGSLVGVVTLEDILEALFGMEIMDESDSVPNLQRVAKQLWERRAKKLGLEGKGSEEKK